MRRGKIFEKACNFEEDITSDQIYNRVRYISNLIGPEKSKLWGIDTYKNVFDNDNLEEGHDEETREKNRIENIKQRELASVDSLG